MATFKTSDDNQLILTCSCGCDEGLRINIDTSGEELYCYQTYLSATWYKEQKIFLSKLNKIGKLLSIKLLLL